MAEAVVIAQPADLTEQLSMPARIRLTPLRSLADCEIRVGSTVFPHLHKVTLAMESMVLRGLIKDVELSNTITLHDDTAAEIALMISLMYERNSESLNELNVEQVLQLCTKYNMPGVRDAVACFLLTVELDVNNMTKWLAIARCHQMAAVAQRCLRFAEGPGVLHSLFKLHGEQWMRSLDEASQLRLTLPALRAALGQPDPKREFMKRRRYR